MNCEIWKIEENNKSKLFCAQLHEESCPSIYIYILSQFNYTLDEIGARIKNMHLYTDVGL